MEPLHKRWQGGGGGDTWLKELMHNVTPDIVADYIRLWMVIDGLNFDPSHTRPDEIVRLAIVC
jgi:hypothetical protein